MAKKGAGESTFSALGGGAHLKPHCGSTNCRLTAHLPLIVPEGGSSIRVGDEVRQYKEGELMIFDDSWVRLAEYRMANMPHPSPPGILI